MEEIEEKIKIFYLKILERQPERSALSYYKNKIENKEITWDKFQEILKNSSEFQKLQYYKERESDPSLYDKIKKPIFIIAVPRSGTTLLYNIMANHPELGWFSHFEFKNWVTNERLEELKTYFENLKKENKQIPKGEHSTFFFGKEISPPAKNTDRIPLEAETFWSKYFGDDYVNEIRVDFKEDIQKQITSLLENQKKNRFLNKAPQNFKRIYALEKIFPDAKFIHIVRDPRAAISSMLIREKNEGQFKLGVPNENKIDFLKFDSTKKYALQYKEIIEYIYNFGIKSKNFHSLRYEDLIANPELEIKKILRFCELREINPIQKLLPPLRQTTEKWRETLSKDDEQKISNILSPVMKKLGFSYEF